ncbi:Protein bola4, chloroplastic/mitochondrial [Turnera subulata]|uniref:Protein bola4, chloroplastic/mitochondrial n=1 Tax=Turnera subulata TaxID=218843 RepID=A0A9Q0FW52_9ROSI|nr:Protein bola4, chloroplastic/mitochondrial [Turnera subulata]
MVWCLSSSDLPGLDSDLVELLSDLTGSGASFSDGARNDSAFEGKSAVDRQRMVYKAMWEELQNIVHAVDQMVTRTPAEAVDKI